MTQTLFIALLVLLYVQAVISGVALGVWIAMWRNKKTKTVANFFPPEKYVDNSGTTVPPVLKDAKLDNIEIPKRDHPPKSTVTKFPNPEAVRKRKDQETVSAYMEDMQKNKRPSGPFVL